MTTQNRSKNVVDVTVTKRCPVLAVRQLKNYTGPYTLLERNRKRPKGITAQSHANKTGPTNNNAGPPQRKAGPPQRQAGPPQRQAGPPQRQAATQQEPFRAESQPALSQLSSPPALPNAMKVRANQSAAHPQPPTSSKISSSGPVENLVHQLKTLSQPAAASENTRWMDNLMQVAGIALLVSWALRKSPCEP